MFRAKRKTANIVLFENSMQRPPAQDAPPMSLLGFVSSPSLQGPIYWNISRCHLGEKYEKGKTVKEKGRKGKENGRKGK
jgi:hypothetical protein